MAVKEKRVGDVAVLRVSGKLMGGNETQEVHQQVKRLVGEGTTKLVIDLSKVRWLNSQGLGMLMGCLTSSRSAGGDMKLAGTTEKVNSLLMITKLITIFESFDSADKAVASFE